MDGKFKEFSIAAIKKQPMTYFFHIFRVAWGDLTRIPYSSDILARLNIKDPLCPNCNPKACRIDWNSNFCLPATPNRTIEQLWGILFIVDRQFYPLGMSLVAIVAIIGFIRAIIQKQRDVIVVAILFNILLFLQAAAQRIEGRYLIPLYPLYILLVINGFIAIYATGIRFLQLTNSPRKKENNS